MKPKVLNWFRRGWKSFLRLVKIDEGFEEMTIDELRKREMYFFLVYDKTIIRYKRRRRNAVATRASLSLEKHCRHCGQDVKREDAGLIVGYWTPIWFIAHKVCEKPGKQAEAYECQKIAADCNDCAYFQRGQHNKRFNNENLLNPKKYELFSGQPDKDAEEQKRYIVAGLAVGSFDGTCQKYNKPTRGWPNQATMMPCFVHRKDGVPEEAAHG